MELLIARPSPYARKIRVALIEKGIPCEITVDNPWLENPRIQTVNPIGKVPALITDSGDVIHDSKVIFEYIETMFSGPTLTPDNAKERIAHKQIEAICDGICDAVVLIALEGTRPEEKQSEAWVERQTRKIYAGVEEINARLNDRKSFTALEFGLAEISTVVMLEYIDFRFSEFDWRPLYPALFALFSQISLRDSFVKTKPEGQTLPKH
jgi:glutathione S-transferase